MKTKLITIILLAASGLTALAQQKTLTGIVKDGNGEPVIGASIMSPDGKKGVIADFDGKFTYTLEGEKILVVSCIGYISQNISVSGWTDGSTVVLREDSKTLDEIVVIGYGTAKKSDLTGSVSVVKMTEIEDMPVTSVDQALQGKIAGAEFMTTTGEPGAGTSIRIRGTRSITASNEPLIVVDGVVDAVESMNEINPTDIETINILKDASSTAIYGSRGANGVVIITTRKGVTSRPSVTAKATYGISTLAKKLDVMNRSEFVRYLNDRSYINNYIVGKKDVLPAYDVRNYPTDTDWQKEITRIGQVRTVSVSVSGKSSSTSYLASVGYNDTQGIVDGSGFKRGTVRFKVSHSFTKWLSMGLNLSYTYMSEDPNKVNIGGTNVFTGAIYLTPFMGPRDSTNPLYENGTSIDTPRNSIDMKELNKRRQIGMFVADVTINPIAGLEFKSVNSYRPNQVHVRRYHSSTLPTRHDGKGGEAFREEYDSIELMSENTVSYKLDFGSKNHFDAMVGFSASTKTVNDMQITAGGIIDDSLKWYNLNAVGSKENYNITSNTYRIVRESVYTRLNYNYGSRYYLTFTARGDGSSNFAANRKWGFFPSGAAKWSISSENWMRGAKWLDNLAIRASYGLTGNDAIAAYRSLGVYSSSTTTAIFENTQSASFYPSRLENPDLSWEKTRTLNVGLDFAAFKERLSITLDAYWSKTTDLLLTMQTVQSTGFNSRLTNIGQTSNRGIELGIESRNFVKKNFSWTTSFTISHNNQMVDDIGHESYVSQLNSTSNYMMYGYRKGYPLNALWGFKYAGTWKSEDEIIANETSHKFVGQKEVGGGNYSALLGLAKYEDIDHDGMLSNNDLCYLGSSDPIIYGGLHNSFNIYGLKVSIDLSYSIGGKIYNFSELTMAGSYYTNQYRYMLDAWHPVRNPNSDTPRAGGVTSHVNSSLQVHDASYLRLKAASISYTFDLSKKTFLKGITIGVSGENLFLWSRYNGFDPDVSTESDTSTLRRVDMGAYPRARTVVFTLQVKL